MSSSRYLPAAPAPAGNDRLHVVLFQPEIPPNTGNVMRLCANSGASLHLIHPLGFELDDRRLRRAGLDYREWLGVREYNSLDEFRRTLPDARLLALTTRGERSYAEVAYRCGDALLFGPETRGLPDRVLECVSRGNRLFIPMMPRSRSLNLSNAVAIVVYEAWRQLGFAGAGRISAPE